jgi:CrcB protein
MARFFFVCLGGAVGTGARYLVSVWALRTLGPAFPFGTLIVNVLGSFLLGALMHVGLTTSLLSPTLRLVLTTGVMGGFTTYSTFNYETLQYLSEGALGLGALNVLGTLATCLVAGIAGVGAARALVGG